MWVPIGLGGRERLERSDVYAALLDARKGQHELKSQAKALLNGSNFSELGKVGKMRAEADIRALYECCEHHARILEAVLRKMDETKKSTFLSEKIIGEETEHLTGSVVIDKTYYFY